MPMIGFPATTILPLDGAVMQPAARHHSPDLSPPAPQSDIGLGSADIAAQCHVSPTPASYHFISTCNVFSEGTALYMGLRFSFHDNSEWSSVLIRKTEVQTSKLTYTTTLHSLMIL
jgi:hypothetical protein